MKQKTRNIQNMLLSCLIVSVILNVVFLMHAWQNNIVTSVPDGDSLQLSNGQRIRLLGIDAPEREMCMATQARETLEKAVKGRHVRLKHTVTDDYGRTLAIVIVEDLPAWISYLKHWFQTVIASPNGVAIPSGSFARTQDDDYVDPLLNRLVVSRGLARFAGAKGEYSDTIKDAQSIAKENKLGIWSDTCRGTISANPDCIIKGNTRGSDRIYHLPECKNYDQTIVDTAFGDHWFCTETEAIQAGFSRASGCVH